MTQLDQNHTEPHCSTKVRGQCCPSHFSTREKSLGERTLQNIPHESSPGPVGNVVLLTSISCVFESPACEIKYI